MSQQQKAATEQQGPVASRSVRATAGANQPNAPPRQERQASSPHSSVHRSRRNQGAAGGSGRDELAVNSRRNEQPAASVRPAISHRLGPRAIADKDAKHLNKKVADKK